MIDEKIQLTDKEFEELSYFVAAFGEPSKQFPEAVREQIGKKSMSTHVTYERAKNSGDAVLIGKAIDDFVQSDPEFAFNCGKSDNDYALLNRAGWSLLEKNPEKAHYAGVLSNDAQLKEKALKAFFESNPGYSLMYGAENNKDVELVRAACENLLDKDPMDVILGAKIINDERLVNLAKERLQSEFEDVIDKNFDRAVTIAYRTEDRSQLSAVGWKYLDKNPLEAYSAGCVAGDLELKKASCLKSLESDPKNTYFFAAKYDDLEIRLAAGLKLLETDSQLAYHFALKYKDLPLLSKAREKLLKEGKKLVKTDVSAAFDIARLVNDYNLVAQCGPRLLDEYPEKAYKAGRLVSDQQLMDSAVDRLIQTGYADNLMSLAGEEHDVNLLRKALELGKEENIEYRKCWGLHIALQLCDTETIEDLGAKVQPAFEALKMGLTFRNKALLKIGGWRVLKEDDSKLSSSMGYAYEAGKILGDKDLMKAVLSKIKDGLSPNVASLVQEHYLGD